MNRFAVLALLVAGFWLGAALRTPAAPGDVVGSSNVAVDVYRNSRGSFILWASGRITDVRGGGADLGAPYSDPPSSANIGSTPPLLPAGTQGSGQVAVEAVVRSDGTYILFADGRLRKPSSADAGAGMASEQSNVIAGCWRNGASADPSRYTVVVGGSDVFVTLNEPLNGEYVAWAAGLVPGGGDGIPYNSVRGNGGTSITFHQADGVVGVPPNGCFFITQAP